MQGQAAYLWMENRNTASFFLIFIHNVSHLGGQSRQALWDTTLCRNKQEDGTFGQSDARGSQTVLRFSGGTLMLHYVIVSHHRFGIILYRVMHINTSRLSHERRSVPTCKAIWGVIVIAYCYYNSMPDTKQRYDSDMCVHGRPWTLIFPTLLQLYDLHEKLRHIFFKRSYLRNKYLCILQ